MKMELRALLQLVLIGLTWKLLDSGSRGYYFDDRFVYESLEEIAVDFAVVGQLHTAYLIQALNLVKRMKSVLRLLVVRFEAREEKSHCALIAERSKVLRVAASIADRTLCAAATRCPRRTNNLSSAVHVST